MIRKLDQLFYPDYTNNWDDKIFREHLLNNIRSDWKILDVGAGAGIISEMNFRGLAKNVVGVDPDPRVLTNSYLDEAYIGLGDEMRFLGDNEFDLAFCDNVFEHIQNPTKFLAEINRVLKPGGMLMAKTPNKFHYMPIVAQLTPTWFHKFYNKIRGRQEEDTFPTLYKLNSQHSQKKFCEKSEFEAVEFSCIEGRPEYLRITWITYLLGFVYERIINLFNINKLKILIISKWTNKI